MKAKDMEFVQTVVESEGFDYAFRFYSDFEEVNDNKFHKLLENYRKAAKELAEYTATN